MRALFAALFATLGGIRRAIMLLALLASLTLNVATVTSTAVFAAVSGTVSAVTGASTVLARATAERSARKQAVRRTSQRVTRRVQRTAARNSASVFGEAIPIAGAAVIAAALAFEIKDACDTARDMHVLEGLVDDPSADPEMLALGFDCTTLIPEAADLPGTTEIWEAMRSAPGAAWETAQGLYGDMLPAETVADGQSVWSTLRDGSSAIWNLITGNGSAPDENPESNTMPDP